MQDSPQPKPSGTDKSREQRFVETVIDRCNQDKGLAARLRRADNPATEYQSWEMLGRFGVNLENDFERLPYAVIAAAIVRSKAEYNGSLTLGWAIAACYEDGRESEQAKTRLRRLLACNDLKEACRILRPLLGLINSKVKQPLDYTCLLRQLRFYGQRTRIQWAQEFYHQPVESAGGEDETCI